MSNNRSKENKTSCSCNCTSNSSTTTPPNSHIWKTYLPTVISLVLLSIGLGLDHFYTTFFTDPIRLATYALAYFPVGLPVIKEAWENIRKGEFFTEYTLMTLATFGAFGLTEYPEGVAVMLFYTLGELFQGNAVNKAKRSIESLLNVRSNVAQVWVNGSYVQMQAKDVKLDQKIQVRPGEKIPLDSILISESASLNTAAITGESRPKTINKNESALAGMINLGKVIELKVSKNFEDSSIARIIEMVQHAIARKAKTELLIRRLAKIYTPIVFFLSIALIIIPYFIVENYIFIDWMYRALVFLVISCPCALVVSIPLAYFGGIGAASRNGILFKGSNYLDLLSNVDTIVMDKTGTLTKGVFELREAVIEAPYSSCFLNITTAVEAQSTHPIAKAICKYARSKVATTDETYICTQMEELAGYGLKATVINVKQEQINVLIGNSKLFNQFKIAYPSSIDQLIETTVLVSINNCFAGYLLIADEIKPDALSTLLELKKMKLKTVLLSGDKQAIVDQTAQQLGISQAHGNLLPQDKVDYLNTIKNNSKNSIIAFVGDGINDAPVLALSDIGIAMGAMGSDAAIETADVVIQNDQLSQISTAITIAKQTKQIVFQNIALAITVKAIVLILGAGGIATMWEAVFADVGVALLAILNAVRMMRYRGELRSPSI